MHLAAAVGPAPPPAHGWAAPQAHWPVEGRAALWNAMVGGEAQPAGISPGLLASGAPRVAMAEPGAPMVLWCEAKPTRQQEVMEALAAHYGAARPQLVYLETTSRFTRWLFEQPRGEVTPWALLVCGWREAKPCATAIAAARTGDVSQLRPDARRPQLPPVTGSPEDGAVGVALQSMLVVLEKAKEEARVVMWAEDSGRATAGLDIHVAGDACPVREVMARMNGDARKSLVSL